MKKSKKYLVAIVLAISISQAVPASDIFNVNITTVGESKNFGFSNAEDIISQFNNESLGGSFGGYVDNVSEANAILDFRGVEMLSNYALNSTNLNFSIPSLGISRTFSGATRSESARRLFDFLTNSKDAEPGENVFERLTKALVANSPTDPLAGNPTSLMGELVDTSFSEGSDIEDIDINKMDDTINNSFGIGAHMGRFNQGGKKVNSYTIPLSRKIRFDTDPRQQLIVSIPLSYTKAQGAEAFKGAFSLVYKHPVSYNWTVTPGFNYGLMYSSDLGSVGQIISGTLTSHYRFRFDKFNISLANMVGYFQTLPLKIKNVDIDTDISNWVIKNGLIVDYPIRFSGIDYTVKGYFTDTEFFGDRLFAEQYNEIGFSVKATYSKGMLWDMLGLSAKYIFSAAGDDVEGFKVDLSYEF